ncbi:MAG: TlpA disulfide reductase family protein [Glaciecola sp.]
MNKTSRIFASVFAALALVAGISLAYINQTDFTTISGEQYKHSDLSDKIVIVNYFAEWCAPCLREIPELNTFYKQKPSNVALFGVSYDNLTTDQLIALKQKYDIEFDLINAINTPFVFEKPQYLPATFVINKDGEMAGQLLGEQTAQGLLEAIQQLNQQP